MIGLLSRTVVPRERKPDPDWLCPRCGMSFVPVDEAIRPGIFEAHVKSCRVPGGKQ